MMRLVDADQLKSEYPDRKSLNTTLNKAKTVTITQALDNMMSNFCNNFCKVPTYYSKGEWEQILEDESYPENCKCNECPFNII